MKKMHFKLHGIIVMLCTLECTKAVINITLTGTTTRHVCKGEDIDFRWTYDDTDPDKDFISIIRWRKDPSGYLIMEYETGNLYITSSPNDYTERVERTTTAGSNDIGMRLKQAGSTDVDDDGKYYVSLIVDKDPGDANDYFVPYRDPQGVQVYVCVGVDDTLPLPSLSLTYDETTHVIKCTGPRSLGNTTFAIFDPSMNVVIDSTTDVTITKDITAVRPSGTYICKAYCTRQGYGNTPQGTCLPTDATLVLQEPVTVPPTVPNTVPPILITPSQSASPNPSPVLGPAPSPSPNSVPAQGPSLSSLTPSSGSRPSLRVRSQQQRNLPPETVAAITIVCVVIVVVKTFLLVPIFYSIYKVMIDLGRCVIVIEVIIAIVIPLAEIFVCAHFYHNHKKCKAFVDLRHSGLYFLVCRCPCLKIKGENGKPLSSYRALSTPRIRKISRVDVQPCETKPDMSPNPNAVKKPNKLPPLNHTLTTKGVTK